MLTTLSSVSYAACTHVTGQRAIYKLNQRALSCTKDFSLEVNSTPIGIWPRRVPRK